MKTKLLAGVFLGVLAFGAALGAGADKEKAATNVQVTFVEPDKFTDVKDSYMDSERGREAILDQLKEHLVTTGGRYLAPGQKLEVKVTDVDLAGDFEPWRGPNFQDVRIVKDLYPPRASLEFRLTGADGKVISEGKRQLRDYAFLMTSALPTSDPLRHDKQMLSDWLRGEFKRS